MSYFETREPECQHDGCPKQIDLEIIPRSVDLGGFTVGRVLPSAEKRSVGPFIFWDQAGPGEFLTGNGLDVRPHPHICLSTMTYLFRGRLEHRDTLGSHQIIEAGAVNLMTAGRGIAHSERTPQSDRLHANPLFGIQAWLALPLDKEELPPAFAHYDVQDIPAIRENGAELKIAAGEWGGARSPVNTYCDALFAECHLQKNTDIYIPAAYEERAIHVLSGEIMIGKTNFHDARMLILKPGAELKLTAITDAHIIILGGSPLDKPRYMWWNFVASSKERIEQAKEEWSAGKFGKIPGDDKEFIPLP